MVNHTPTFNLTPTVTPSPTPTFNPTPTVTPTYTSNFTPSSSKRKFTKTSAYRRNKNVIDMEPVHLLANVNVQESKPLPANANTTQNETVESIVQELLSMNYEFDPFEDNMTASINDQPSVNEQERDREEGDSDSEDDEDYFVDEDSYLEEVNVDMADYHFNIDTEFEWVRHSNSGIG
ncbi:hypothetical protein Tco_0118581, partial [Tanacetum coccineum]